MFSLVIFLSFFCSHKFSAHIFIFCMLMLFFPSRLFPCSALAFPNVIIDFRTGHCYMCLSVTAVHLPGDPLTLNEPS